MPILMSISYPQDANTQTQLQSPRASKSIQGIQVASHGRGMHCEPIQTAHRFA